MYPIIAWHIYRKAYLVRPLFFKMPPKKRRVEKKRKRREHPKVEAWSKIATLATQITKCTQQIVQYKALLKQIIDTTCHDKECPENIWETQELSETLENDIKDYINNWLKDVLQNSSNIKQTRDDALKTLRTIDVLDDQALKAAALILAETEFQCEAMEQLIHKWNKIVRYNETTTVQKHTDAWLIRWLKQWNHTRGQLERLRQFFTKELNNPFIKD